RRVDATGLRVDGNRQCIDVRALELVELPVLEDQLRYRVPLGGELLEHTGIRGGSRLRLSNDRQLQFLEQYRTELRRRADVEFSTSDLVDLLGRELQRTRQVCIHAREELAVDEDALPFHFREYRQQR